MSWRLGFKSIAGVLLESVKNPPGVPLGALQIRLQVRFFESETLDVVLSIQTYRRNLLELAGAYAGS